MDTHKYTVAGNILLMLCTEKKPNEILQKGKRDWVFFLLPVCIPECLFGFKCLYTMGEFPGKKRYFSKCFSM